MEGEEKDKGSVIFVCFCGGNINNNSRVAPAGSWSSNSVKLGAR